MNSAFSWENSVSLCPAYLLLHVSLDFYFCIPVPFDEEDIFFWVLVLEGLIGLHRTIQFQLLQHYWQAIELDYCDIE